MPKGKVSFVIRLFPLVPGYTRMVCAEATAAQATARSVDESILADMLVFQASKNWPKCWNQRLNNTEQPF